MNLEVHNLSIIKNQKQILKNISLKLPEAALTVIIGPNAAGKSTLLRSMLGLEGQTNKITWGAKTLDSFTTQQRAQMISWSGETCSPSFSYTVFELVLMGLFPWHLGRPQAEHKQSVKDILRLLGIDYKANSSVFELSSGEQKKMTIARTLVSRCRVSLLDEPEANLDVGCAFQVMELFKTLVKEEKRTLCLTMHDIHLAKHFADWIVFMKEGEIVVQGLVRDVMTLDLLTEVYGLKHELVKKLFSFEGAVPSPSNN